jgi:hypothetical protein
MPKPGEILEMILSDSREAGSEGALQARRVMAGYLSSLGFRVEEQRFQFSASTVTVYPLFGAGLGWLMLVQIPLLTVPRAPAWAALAAWGVGVVALGLLLAGVALGWAPVGGQPREAANLVAVRGTGTPRRWIVAHYDTKAQGMSLGALLWAGGYAAIVVLLLTMLAVWRLRAPLDVDLVAGAAILALVACGLASRGGLAGTSPGARDNASGVLAALTAAAHATSDDLGILLTSAQEFGLVGARIFAQERGTSLPGVEVVNLDVLDDVGRLRVCHHNAAGAGLAREIATRLGRAGLEATSLKIPVLAPLESAPMARSGAVAVTITRCDRTTLARLHTRADTLEGLDFQTATAVGQALAGSI